MDCNVIKDLLPLYADGLTSESSNAVIEAHIKTCPTCRKLKEQMCSPMEPEPAEEEKAYLGAVRAQQRKTRRRMILACAATVLVCVIGWWIYMETHFKGERIVTVSTDAEQILAEMPEVSPAQAEIDLAKTILDHQIFRDALSYDIAGTEELLDSIVVFEPEDVMDIIDPALPEAATVEAVEVIADSISIIYRVGDLRTNLIYTDGDHTGHVDIIEKYVADTPYEYINGIQFAGDVDEAYRVTYSVVGGIAQYEKYDSQHIWFGFLDP